MTTEPMLEEIQPVFLKDELESRKEPQADANFGSLNQPSFLLRAIKLKVSLFKTVGKLRHASMKKRSR